MAGEVPKPKWIAWEITGKCNLNCIHCRSSSGMDTDSGDISTEEACGWMDQIADYASPVLVLSGGEPLLRDDWCELARYGTEKGLRVCLATNGALVEEATCARIRSVGIRMVSLSLDGSTETVHDDFRQQPGAFQSVIRAAELFRRYEIPFLINSSFTRRNQSDIPNVYRLAKELRATAWYMFMIVPTGRGEEAQDELISGEDYEKILNWHYEQEVQEDQILMRPTCAPHYFRILRERSRREGRDWKPRSLRFATGVSKGCLAGQHIAFIDRFGHVKPCSYFPESAGNVREKPFRDIWEGSPLFHKLRDPGSYQGKCGLCEYLHVCGGCRARASAMNQGNYLAEEPFCTYGPRKKQRKTDPTGGEDS
jgi:radical SAM protein with 4Fe4S-binding SPASM domain